MPKKTSTDPMAKFYSIISSIMKNVQELQEFDTFGATALASVVNLLLSRDEEYVKMCNQNQKNTLQIPDAVKVNVDSIINSVKTKLAQDKKTTKAKE